MPRRHFTGKTSGWKLMEVCYVCLSMAISSRNHLEALASLGLAFPGV